MLAGIDGVPDVSPELLKALAEGGVGLALILVVGGFLAYLWFDGKASREDRAKERAVYVQQLDRIVSRHESGLGEVRDEIREGVKELREGQARIEGRIAGIKG